MQGFRCFRGMSLEETAAAARHLEMMHLPPTQTLFRQGDPCDAMYLLRSGGIEIERSVPGRKDYVLMTLEADTIFGEIAAGRTAHGYGQSEHGCGSVVHLARSVRISPGPGRILGEQTPPSPPLRIWAAGSSRWAIN